MNKSTVNINKQIISLFSGQSSVITTPRLYIDIVKSHTLATVLNQCVFWSNKSSDKYGYFYKSYADWNEEICIKERTLRNKFYRLEEMGLISTKVKMVYGKPLKHIHANIDKIIEAIQKNADSVPISDEIQEQNTCAKTAPTGKKCRNVPAKNTETYTDDYSQKIITAAAASAQQGEFSRKENMEKNAYSSTVAHDMFNVKFKGYDITYDYLFETCKKYHEEMDAWLTESKWMKWINREKLDDHKKQYVESLDSKQSKEVLESKAFDDTAARDLFNNRFGQYDVTYESMYSKCKAYYDDIESTVTKSKWIKWIQREKIESYAKKGAQVTTGKRVSEEKKQENDKWLAYNSYMSGFKNDKYRLKLDILKDAEMLSFEDWETICDAFELTGTDSMQVHKALKHA